MYSWAMVPSGVMLLRIANQTFEVPAKYCGTSRFSVCTTSSCHGGEAAARAEVGNLEVELGLDRAHERNLGFQPASPLVEVRPRKVRRKKSSDDGEHRDLVEDRVQPRPADRDVDLARLLPEAGGYELLVELEKPEEVDEVRLHEAQAAQICELVVAKAQPQLGELAVDAVEIRAQIRAFRAALELVLDLRAGKK